MKKPRDSWGEHRTALDKIAEYLIKRETITGKEFMKIFRAVEKGLDIPENLDDLVIPGEPKGIEAEEHAEEVKTDSVQTEEYTEAAGSDTSGESDNVSD